MINAKSRASKSRGEPKSPKSKNAWFFGGAGVRGLSYVVINSKWSGSTAARQHDERMAASALSQATSDCLKDRLALNYNPSLLHGNKFE